MKKRPESVLVVIYCSKKRSLLLMRRLDDPDFWQSITGSLESDEVPLAAALREVFEETGIDIIAHSLYLEDIHYSVTYEIFSQFRHRYADDVTHNIEHWFYLDLPDEWAIRLTEHSAYCWQPWQPKKIWSKSWNNQQALERLIKKFE